MNPKSALDEFLKPPEIPWLGPDKPFSCVWGIRRAMLDAERLFERAGRKFKRPVAPDLPEVRFLVGGGYKRFEWSGHAILSHGESGSVYLDQEKQTYIHRAPFRPYVPEEVAPKAAAESDEPIEAGRLLKIQFASPIDLEWEGIMRESKELAAFSDALIEVMFGGADHVPGLVRKHLPQYTLIRMECWQVDRKGKRHRKLSEVALDDLRVAQARPEGFRIPTGYRDLRKRPSKGGQWYPFPVPVKPPPKDDTTPPPPRQQQLATVAAPSFPFKPDFELPLPSCLPSTLRVSASFELHQILLDHIRHVGNVLTTRLGGFEAHRPANDTKVTLTVNWLDQLRASHDNIGIADGFFCLLVNDDTDHAGVMQRRALVDARSLVAGASTLPLGPSNKPLVLDAPTTAEIQALLDAQVPRAERFDQLSQTAQDSVRDAVLNQRLGRFEQTFEGDSGELRWPDNNGDLLRYRSQLESVSLQLNFEEIIESLEIVDRRHGPTLIRLRARVPEFSLTYEISWFPGLNLGLLIGAALVVTPVALPVAVIVLLGMGPVGWGILLAALAALPTLVPEAILAIDILVIMMSSVTLAKIALANGTLLVEMEPGTDGTSAAVLRPTKVSFNGDVTLSLDSELPRSSQPIIEDVLAWAVNAFDLARGAVEDALKEFLREKLADVPHTRIPLGFTFEAAVPADVPGEPELFEPVLEHELTAFDDDGVAHQRIGYAVLAKSSFQPPEHGAYFTQVDPDLRPIWRGFADQLADQMLYGGYGLSQNLLNSWAHGQWLAQRLQSGIGASTLRDAADIIRRFCPDCLCTGNLEGHVWAASSPRLLVQHELFVLSEEHPYLNAIFSDLRLCLSCSDDDPKGTLEIQFSAQTIAEVGFGSVGEDTLTLLTADPQFGDIYYDASPDVFALNAGRLGVVTDGDAFKVISALSPQDQINFARAMSGVLEDAAGRIFRQNPVTLIGKVPSDPPRRDRQLYDVIEGRIFARRSSLYVIFTPNGSIRGALPAPDGTSTIDLATINCPDAITLLAGADVP